MSSQIIRDVVTQKAAVLKVDEEWNFIRPSPVIDGEPLALVQSDNNGIDVRAIVDRGGSDLDVINVL